MVAIDLHMIFVLYVGGNEDYWRFWVEAMIIASLYLENQFICYYRGLYREFLGQRKYVLNVTLWFHTVFFSIHVTFLLPHLLGKTYLSILLETKINDNLL